jgi:hypothetical protein
MPAIDFDARKIDIRHVDIEQVLYDYKTMKMLAVGEFCFVGVLLIGAYQQSTHFAKLMQRKETFFKKVSEENDNIVSQNSKSQFEAKTALGRLNFTEDKLQEERQKNKHLQDQLQRLRGGMVISDSKEKKDGNDGGQNDLGSERLDDKQGVGPVVGNAVSEMKPLREPKSDEEEELNQD